MRLLVNGKTQHLSFSHFCLLHYEPNKIPGERVTITGPEARLYLEVLSLVPGDRAHLVRGLNRLSPNLQFWPLLWMLSPEQNGFSLVI